MRPLPIDVTPSLSLRQIEPVFKYAIKFSIIIKPKNTLVALKKKKTNIIK
jgi:hypothetical protein